MDPTDFFANTWLFCNTYIQNVLVRVNKSRAVNLCVKDVLIHDRTNILQSPQGVGSWTSLVLGSSNEDCFKCMYACFVVCLSTFVMSVLNTLHLHACIHFTFLCCRVVQTFTTMSSHIHNQHYYSYDCETVGNIFGAAWTTRKDEDSG